MKNKYERKKGEFWARTKKVKNGQCKHCNEIGEMENYEQWTDYIGHSYSYHPECKEEWSKKYNEFKGNKKYPTNAEMRELSKYMKDWRKNDN